MKLNMIMVDWTNFIVLSGVISLLMIMTNAENVTTMNSQSVEKKLLNGNESLNRFQIRFCQSDDADDFPNDLFTDEQKRHGAILLHLLGAVYFFILLAIICDEYFLPSVQCICEDLEISKDMAAATFMATATTVPELFTNTIATFITESDIGVGTIIGSTLFNTLGVAAIAGLASVKPVQLNWWPITRDSIYFLINVFILMIFTWDNKIDLYESIIMACLVIVYYIIIFQSPRLSRFARGYVEDKWLCFHPDKRRSYNVRKPQESPACSDPIEAQNEFYFDKSSTNIFIIPTGNDAQQQISNEKSETIDKTNEGLWRLPHGSRWLKIWWFFVFPIKFLLHYTIPNPVTHRRFYPLTFLLCICWIGVNTYMITWMITTIGTTISIPTILMGLIFLAAGSCMPEGVSSVIMIRKGEGGIGVSNSLGANSLAILMSLGLPWLVKNVINEVQGRPAYIPILAPNIEYTLLLLLAAPIILYIVIVIFRFRLKKIVGFILLCGHLIILVVAILIQFGILVPLNGDSC